MAAKAKRPIPEGYHTVTPYLIVRGGVQALEFYRRAFGAQELFRMAMPDGRLGHAEIRIGDSNLMLADEFPERNVRGPQSVGGTPVTLCLYVADCDALFAQAVAAGAKIEHPLENQFYGDRSGTVSDPYGHQWTISTHVEDLTPEEIQKRAPHP